MNRQLLAASLFALAFTGCSLFVRSLDAESEAAEAPDAASPDDPDATFVGVSAIDSASVPEGLSPYWNKVRAGGPLIIGINTNYPPFGAPVDPAKRGPGDSAAFVGFDVDLAEHLGATLGVPVELRAVRSNDVMIALRDGTIDLALAGLTRTVYRAAQVNFSAPYLTVSQAALVARRLVQGSRGTDEERRRDTLESYGDLASLSGLKIGVAKFTRPHRLALNRFPAARLSAYPTIADASRALIDGEVDALVHDDPYIRVWARLHKKHAGRFSELLKPVTEEPIAIAIRKGDLEFLRFLDAYVEEVREDGTVARFYRRHFVDAVWLDLAETRGGE